MKRKSLVCKVMRNGEIVFDTPISTPDVVVGLMSTLAIPSNQDLSIVVSVDEIVLPDEKENN